MVSRPCNQVELDVVPLTILWTEADGPCDGCMARLAPIVVVVVVVTPDGPDQRHPRAVHRVGVRAVQTLGLNKRIF